MYSLVMMMAMNGPVAEAPAHLFWWRHGCSGCSGCCGGCCGGCYGGGHGWHHRGGCCGGCYGGCCGGYAACYGCSGCYGVAHACGGCVGCMGYGFAGCYGSCYGSYTNYFSYWQEPPATYGYGTPMYPTVPGTPSNVVPVNPAGPPAKSPVKPAAPGKAPEAAIQGNPATVTVVLPAEATLYANGVRMIQKSEERKFVTPVMEPNQRYHYIFTAEIERDGQTLTETKKVEVWSGAEVYVDFGAMTAAKPRPDLPSLVISPK
ncbi:MAG TPA: TIGR03000 domain-containing protein [Gemmataceae bacterium]|nr:TIGR03000 domain-containing protein [Gemmataceae bacterium]